MSVEKKHTLKVEYDIDFTLIAISSELRAYKLAWTLNRELSLHFIKCDDLSLDFKDGARISLTHYLHKKQYEWIRLVENRASDAQSLKRPFLLPELEQFNYLITIYSEVQQDLGEQVLGQLGNIPEVTFSQLIDASELKSKDNLIF